MLDEARSVSELRAFLDELYTAAAARPRTSAR